MKSIECKSALPKTIDAILNRLDDFTKGHLIDEEEFIEGEHLRNVSILDEDDEKISVECSDGSVCFNILREWIEIEISERKEKKK